MHMRTRTKKHFLVLVLAIFLAAALSSCGKEAEQEAEERAFGIDYSAELAVRLPEQVICGEKNAWVITTVKNDFIYQLSYDTGTAAAENIEWQQNEAENLINIAERDGTLYAETSNPQENTIEIRRRSAGGNWAAVMTINAENTEWYTVGSGLFVDSSENAYLVSGDTVTRFGVDGAQVCAYKLGGSICFFLENGDGYVECVAAEIDGITLYELKENKAEEKWTCAVSAGQIHCIRSSGEGTLCLATNEELLFLERESGSLLARSDLVQMGVASVLAGNYNAEEETLWLYGTGTDGLSCSLLSGRDASKEQRTELVYGMVGGTNTSTESGIWTAIAAFNQENEDYYITIKNYGGWSSLERLHADMAGGSAPDVIDMTYSDYYESYVKNGYLEDLYPYLEQSEYKDDLIWNVLEAYEVDGGLYLFTPQFQLEGVLINPDYEAYVEEWNAETLSSFVEKNQWEKDLFACSGNPERLLYYMLCGRQEEFIDWEQKTAAFESEEFLRLLALCREYGEADLPGASEWTYEEHMRNTLCMPAKLVCFTSYLADADIYGREHPVYGYPAASGQTYRVEVCANSCAIYAGSKKKEGAWEFIESLLQESNQNYKDISSPGFPIRSSVLLEMEAGEKKDSVKVGNELLTMTDSEILIVEDIIYQGELRSALINWKLWTVIEEETASYFAGDKSAEEVAHIIQSRVEIILNE